MAREAIYLFAVDGIVRYVGICADLQRRLNNYRTAYQSSTNKRVRQNITQALELGKNVLIYAKLINGESTLIKKLGPEWNQIGRTTD